MTKESFTTWLVRQKDRDDIVGDLAGDVARDCSWPASSRSLSRLLVYLRNRGACDGAVQALRAAWREWEEVGREPVLS